ncbi:MAG: hypothetical protein VX034_02010, partial [Planctomycetota bacterium]|nr:hypothetical protein [Planctomycetota bacterium]
QQYQNDQMNDARTESANDIFKKPTRWFESLGLHRDAIIGSGQRDAGTTMRTFPSATELVGGNGEVLSTMNAREFHDS